MNHRGLVGGFFRYGVNNVERKVETLRVLEFYRGRSSVFVRFVIDEVVVNSLFMFRSAVLGCGLRCRPRFRKFGNGFARRVQNYRIEKAVSAVNRDHSVRGRTVVINAVAGAEHCNVFANLNFQVSLYYNIAFLSRMRCQFYVPVRVFLVIFADNVKRVGDAVSESRRQIVIHHRVGFRNLLSLPSACNDARIQSRA